MRTGCRERNLVSVAAGARFLVVGRAADGFFEAVALGRAGRDGRVVDFDMVFSLVDRAAAWRTARKFEAEATDGLRADVRRVPSPRAGRSSARGSSNEENWGGRKSGSGEPAGSAAACPRRRRMLEAAAAATTAPATTAANATPGEGAAGAGVPLPQVASAHCPGKDSGDSATRTTAVAELAVAEATLCGTNPPTIAAAMTATRPTRHLRDM